MSKIMVIRTTICGGCTDTILEKNTKLEDAIKFTRAAWSDLSETEQNDCDSWVCLMEIEEPKTWDEDFVENMEKGREILFIDSEGETMANRESFKEYIKQNWVLDAKKALVDDFYSIDQMSDTFRHLGKDYGLSSKEIEEILANDFGYNDEFFAKVNTIGNTIVELWDNKEDGKLFVSFDGLFWAFEKNGKYWTLNNENKESFHVYDYEDIKNILCGSEEHRKALAC